jgi:hypothetical protein
MIQSYIIGIGGVVLLMLIWIVVQSKWRKTFSDHVVDEDALAERSTCGNCGCTSICENRRNELRLKKMIEK